MKNNSFTEKLLKWHSLNKRNLPWKKTRDPYKIWLSEIILQQTRVEQGKPYYKKITRLFPTVKALASAHEDQVIHAWQGLGYYTRARNLHHAAMQIMNDHSGKFPSSYNEILKLKGVGEYTAAAVASFAFELPHAVVDGNVFRVLARVFGVKDNISSSASKKKFVSLANEIIDKKNPGAFNQAIMDFGSMVCKPLNPLCDSCFIRRKCYAYQNNLIQQLPVNKKRQVILTRYFTFLVFDLGDDTIIEKRMENDIWKGLYQFPLIETSRLMKTENLKTELSSQKIFNKNDFSVENISDVVTHKLTHQIILARFIHIKAKRSTLVLNKDWRLVKKTKLNDYGFPKLIVDYIKK